MLPRHLRRTVPAHIASLSSHQHAPPLTYLRYRPTAGSVATFHHTSRRNDEMPKSPFQTFVDVLREELRKNRELQENVKQLQGDVDKFQDSEAMRKARAAYGRARVRGILGTCAGKELLIWWGGGIQLCSLHRASKRTRGCVLQPRN